MELRLPAWHQAPPFPGSCFPSLLCETMGGFPRMEKTGPDGTVTQRPLESGHHSLTLADHHARGPRPEVRPPLSSPGKPNLDSRAESQGFGK